MMLAIGSDHGGFELKGYICDYLSKIGILYKDYGTYSTETMDYPDIAKTVCEAVISEEAEKAILICGTGIGISIAANKVNGIRAALCSDCYSAKMTREHNNSNVLCMGGRVIGAELAIMIVETWLNADFVGMHHQTRIDKITAMEK